MREPSGQPTTSTDRGAPRAASKTARAQRALKTRLTLRPGDNGTKKLVHKYGDRLLAVRYRYDAAAQRRFKTVELLEEELPWDSAPPDTPTADTPVLVRIAYAESELREQAKAAGARWQQDRKLWLISYAAARALGLEARIVQ